MLSHVLTGTTRFARRSLDHFNARHPWSHNDAFHPWIFTQLPNNRARALDVGCGHGVLVAKLAEHFKHVHGIDPDSSMRRASIDRCAGLSNVTIDDTTLADASPGFDLITMVAVLHHMDLITGLQQVRDHLAEGGRFLCVGLAHSDSMADHVMGHRLRLDEPINWIHAPPLATRRTINRSPPYTRPRTVDSNNPDGSRSRFARCARPPSTSVQAHYRMDQTSFMTKRKRFSYRVST